MRQSESGSWRRWLVGVVIAITGMGAGGWTGAPAAATPYVPPEAHEIVVPLVVQHGDRANCGPTAAAMLLGAYLGIDSLGGLRRLRDAIGQWTWQEYPLRRVSLPGLRPGMTTARILSQALETFAVYLTFARVRHAFLPPEVGAMAALEGHLRDGHPVITLMQSSLLWQSETSGLHWIVVTGYDDGEIVFLDPADGARETIERDQFWRAWRLDEDYRSLPLVESFTGLVADLPVPKRWLAAW